MELLNKTQEKEKGKIQFLKTCENFIKKHPSKNIAVEIVNAAIERRVTTDISFTFF